jgi:hypothetical protein
MSHRFDAAQRQNENSYTGESMTERNDFLPRYPDAELARILGDSGTPVALIEPAQLEVLRRVGFRARTNKVSDRPPAFFRLAKACDCPEDRMDAINKASFSLLVGLGPEGNFSPDEKGKGLKAYAQTILNNALMDIFRSRKTEKERRVEGDVIALGSELPQADALAERGETEDQLLDGIDLPILRRAIETVLTDHLSERDAALIRADLALAAGDPEPMDRLEKERFGDSSGARRTALCRARARFREAWVDLFGPFEGTLNSIAAAANAA